MSLATDHINNIYLPETAEALISMLMAMYQLQDGFVGEETITGMISQSEGTEIDLYDWIRNRIVSETKLVMETYGVKLVDEAPISVVVACLAPLVKLKHPEELGKFEKFIESDYDAETVYSLMVEDVWESDIHPLIHIEEVKPSLIKLLSEHSEEDIATLDSSQRAILITVNKMFPKNKITKYLLTNFSDVDGEFIDFVKLYNLDKNLDRRLTKPAVYIVSLMSIGIYLHGDVWDAEYYVREYLNDTWGSESSLFTYSSVLNSTVRDIDFRHNGEEDEAI